MCVTVYCVHFYFLYLFLIVSTVSVSHGIDANHEDHV